MVCTLVNSFFIEEKLILLGRKLVCSTKNSPKYCVKSAKITPNTDTFHAVQLASIARDHYMVKYDESKFLLMLHFITETFLQCSVATL